MISRRTDIDNDDVWYMYNVEGMSQQAIADYYGVRRVTIHCRLHPEKTKERSRKWRLYNPEKKKESNEKWEIKNPEYMKEYYQDRREEEIERANRWQQENSEYRKEYHQNRHEEELEQARQWRLEHPEYDKEWRMKNPEKTKEKDRKVNARRRGLGNISMNKPFDGSEFHHFSKTHGIHMPAEIHQSIMHNLKTGDNMDAINKEAFEFLDYELIEEAWEAITGDWIKGEY